MAQALAPPPFFGTWFDYYSLESWYFALSDWHFDMLMWHGELDGWRGEVEDIATVVNSRQVEMQSAAIQTNNRQFVLEDFFESIVEYREPLVESYMELNEWHQSLEYVHMQMGYWDTRLWDFSVDMEFWYEIVADFVDSIRATIFLTIPEHIQWEHVTLPEETYLPLPTSVAQIEFMEHPAWTEALSAPPSYDGNMIIDAFNLEFPLLSYALEPMDLDRPAALINYHVPQRVTYHDRMLIDQPLSPLVGPPPRPDDFWASLDFMHNQLYSFDVGEFLSDDILRMVDHSLQNYDMFLQSVRYDISFLFQDNIWLMHDIHFEYEQWLHNLRHDAMMANFAEQDALQNAIEIFTEARETTHEDTQQRLGVFASMMPESRTAAGINQQLVDFAVMPFYFVPLGMREGTPVISVFDPAMAAPETMADTFQWYQTIILIALGGAFVGTVISHVISHFGQKKRAKAEESGYLN